MAGKLAIQNLLATYICRYTCKCTHMNAHTYVSRGRNQVIKFLLTMKNLYHQVKFSLSHTHTHTHTPTHTHTRTHTHTHTHTHTPRNLLRSFTDYIWSRLSIFKIAYLSQHNYVSHAVFCINLYYVTMCF